LLLLQAADGGSLVISQLAGGRDDLVLAAAGGDGRHGTVVPGVLLYCSTTEQSPGTTVTLCYITECKARSAVVISPKADSASSSEATSDRQGCGGGSANEADAGGGLEHGKLSRFVTL